MKNRFFQSSIWLIITAAFCCSSCDDYLSTIPKGEKIPTTWNDYNAFIKNTNFQYNDMTQAQYLLNDIYRSPSQLNTDILTRINYMWLENEDRTLVNSGDNGPYYTGYEAIFNWNLIIESVPAATEATEQQKKMLIAQAKVLRAMNYFHVVNYFADQYTPETASSTRGVPLVKSADLNAPSPQVSVKEVYDFILEDLLAATEDLPLKGETVYHPTKACGYGMLARVYLSMSDYDNALKYARKALDINDELFDWKTYYQENQEKFDDPDKYTETYPPMGMTNPENYVFRFASLMSSGQGTYGKSWGLPMERAARFEQGDLRLITRWKKRTFSTGETLYTGIFSDKFNGGGMRSPEMYHIKAECLARKGNLQAAMDTLNILRKNRILDEYYQPLSASTLAEAIEYIRRDKENEFVQTGIPFWDMRRFNKQAEYKRTLQKTVDGETYTLTPDSHLWIMPFTLTTITNPGNNPITQNTPR